MRPDLSTTEAPHNLACDISEDALVASACACYVSEPPRPPPSPAPSPPPPAARRRQTRRRHRRPAAAALAADAARDGALRRRVLRVDVDASVGEPVNSIYHDDGHCDDGGDGSAFAVCAFGTDCADCGKRLLDCMIECEDATTETAARTQRNDASKKRARTSSAAGLALGRHGRPAGSRRGPGSPRLLLHALCALCAAVAAVPAAVAAAAVAAAAVSAAIASAAAAVPAAAQPAGVFSRPAPRSLLRGR